MTEIEAPARPAVAGRDRALDGLRAIAALAVLATHAGDAAGTAGWRHDLLGAVDLRTGLAIQQLNVGVEVFFVISAFLVYRPFVAAHLGSHAVPSGAWFLVRRFFRVYPAYWVALFVIVGLSAAKTLPDAGSVVANALLVQGWRAEWTGSDVGLRQAWTLVVEVGFYALVPAWAAAVRTAGRRVGPLRAELAGVAVALAGGPVMLWWLQHHRLPLVPAPLPYLGVFAWGMLFAVVDVARPGAGRVLRTPVLPWLAAAVLFGVFVQTTGIDPLATFTLGATDQLVERVVHGVVAALVVAPVALAAAGRPLRAPAWQPLALVGLWSYGFYLWHYVLLDALRDHVLTGGSYVFARLFVTTALLAAACGAASWYLVERPLTRRFRRRR